MAPVLLDKAHISLSLSISYFPFLKCFNLSDERENLKLLESVAMATHENGEEVSVVFFAQTVFFLIARD